MAQRQGPIWIDTHLGKVPITKYQSNQYFAWYKTPTGRWDVTHIKSGCLAASLTKEDNASLLADSLAVMGEVWNTNQPKDIMANEELRTQYKAIVHYWTNGEG